MSYHRLCVAALLIAAAQTAAAVELEWADTSLTLLRGDRFAVDPAEQTTLTVEHASGWSFGDLYFFMDFTDYRGASAPDGRYGEFSPRFSLSKLSGRPFAAGPVKDLLLATTVEFGRGDVETLLVGPGVDLDLPGFDYFQLNLYRRLPNGHRDGDTLQLTPVWSIATPFAGSELIFDGFADWNLTSDGSYRHNLHFNPQLKYDLGRRLDLAPRTLLVGIEYSNWRNKYGIADSAALDSDQSVASLLVQYHFR